MKIATGLLLLLQCAIISFLIYCIRTTTSDAIFAVHFMCIIINAAFGLVNVNNLTRE